MINKKGFTLVELLATIAIMLLIVTIAVPSITGLLNRNNKKVNDAQEKEFISLAKVYMSANSVDLKEGDEYLLSIQNMIDIDLLSDAIELDEEQYNYDKDGVKIYKESGRIKYAFVKNHPCDTVKYTNGCSIFKAEKQEVVYDSLTIPSTGSGGSDGTDFNYMYEDFQSDPNVSKPRLDYLDTATNYLIPVVYDETCDGGYGCWRKANTNKTWYDYSKGAWANVIRVSESKSLCDLRNTGCYDTIKKRGGSLYLSAPEGTEISEDDIQEMLVWIPKFDYKIEGTYEEGVIPSEISIQFNSNINDYKEGNAKTEWYTHPAFKKEIITQNGDEINYELKDIAGFWVQKFEGEKGTPYDVIQEEYTSCYTENYYNKGGASNFSKKFLNKEKMINNFEWAAIAYLSQSDYGRINRCGSITMTKPHIPIGQYGEACSRKNTTYYATAISGMTHSNTYSGHNVSSVIHNYYSQSKTLWPDCDYNMSAYVIPKSDSKTFCGSTSGTIYGVYDMAGGFPEYVFVAMKDEDTDYNITPAFSFNVQSEFSCACNGSSSPTKGNCGEKDQYKNLAETVGGEGTNCCTQKSTYYYTLYNSLNRYIDFKLNYTKYHSYSFDFGTTSTRDESTFKKGDGIYEIYQNSDFLRCNSRNTSHTQAVSGSETYINNSEGNVVLYRGKFNIFDYTVTNGYYEQAVTTRYTYSNIGD